MAAVEHLLDLFLTAYRAIVLALALLGYVLSLVWIFDLVVSGLTGLPPRHLVAFWRTFVPAR